MARFILFLSIVISTTAIGLVISQGDPEVEEKQRVLQEIFDEIAGVENSTSFALGDDEDPNYPMENETNDESIGDSSNLDMNDESSEDSSNRDMIDEPDTDGVQLENDEIHIEEQLVEDEIPAKEEHTEISDEGDQMGDEYASDEGQIDEDYNPFAQQDEAAAFSKTIKIGTPQHVVTNHFGWDVEHGTDGEGLSIYREFPVAFYMKDGVVQLISWGRSGSFEQWETQEGIGRRSSFEDVREAYINFTYKILYRAGNPQPSYVVVDYHTNKLVFEFTDNRVSFIFLCAPEMLEHSYVKNTVFTYDELQEEPF
nr:hypothetical protein [Paenibacillus bovis]